MGLGLRINTHTLTYSTYTHTKQHTKWHYRTTVPSNKQKNEKMMIHPTPIPPLHITDLADKLCSHFLSQRFVNWSLFFCVSLNRKPSLRLYVEMCFLSDNIYDYFNVSQGKVTVPSIDDSEEFILADVSDSRIRKIVFPVTV